MGQYLSIGLVTECGCSKKKLEQQNVTQEELIDGMKNKLHFDPTIYNLSEVNDNYLFTLKPDVLEQQLIPFLEKLYPLLYPDSSDYQSTLDALKKTPPAEWLNFAEEKREEAFQIDEYGQNEYFRFDKPFRPSASIFSTSIMLAAEGKIMMEESGMLFNVFRYCLQQTFINFPIAGAIRIYITG